MRAAAAASIQLYARLWFDLERFNVPTLELQLLTFRLEVVLVLEGCNSKAWRAFLRPEERLTLERTLQSLLEIIAAPLPMAGRMAIDRAQDLLFDALIDQCEQCRKAPLAGERERLAG
jgi:hypothetical protein